MTTHLDHGMSGPLVRTSTQWPWMQLERFQTWDQTHGTPKITPIRIASKYKTCRTKITKWLMIHLLRINDEYIIHITCFYAPKIKVTEMRLQETATLPILWSSWEAGWTNCQFPWWILVAKIDERFGFEAFSYVFIWTLLWPCRFQCDRPTQILQVKQGTHSFVEDVFVCGTHSQATTLHQSQAQLTQQESPNLILGRHWHGLVQREPRTANISVVLQTPHCLGSQVAFSRIRQVSVI